MTSQDKTGEKLVASIRKTKAEATGKPTVSTTEKAAPVAPAAGKPRPAAKKKVVRKPAPTAKAAEPSEPSTTPGYLSTRRVWPD